MPLETEQLQAISRAARRFVDAVENNPTLRMQFEAWHQSAWNDLLQALAASVHDRAMAQFNELRADAIQRIL